MVAAMRMHIADESVALMCSVALRNLGDTSRTRVAVVEAGGLEVIAEALRLHGDNANVVKWCAAVLRNLVDPGASRGATRLLAIGTALLSRARRRAGLSAPCPVAVHVANGVLEAEHAHEHAVKMMTEDVRAVAALVDALHALQRVPRTLRAATGDADADADDGRPQELPAQVGPPPATPKLRALAIRTLVLTLHTLALDNIQVQAQIVMAGGASSPKPRPGLRSAHS